MRGCAVCGKNPGYHFEHGVRLCEEHWRAFASRLSIPVSEKRLDVELQREIAKNSDLGRARKG